MTTTHHPTATVTSRDGTPIAVYRAGAGPALVLVDCALSDHADTQKLAALLATDYTVIGYDRRGRGASGGAVPITLDQEIDDIAAVIDEAGGRALLFGHSSGAALALDAGARLGEGRVTGLYLWEPPYIVNGDRPPVAEDLSARIARLVVRGRAAQAVTLFFREALGIPAPIVAGMRLMPSWRRSVRLAPTLAGDFAALDGLQQGRPLPADRWAALRVPVYAVAGAKSEPFFHATTRALAELLPTVTAASLPGGNHGTPIMAPEPLAADIRARMHG